MEQILEQRELHGPADQSTLEPVDASRTAEGSGDTDRPPQDSGSVLPFSACSPAGWKATAARLASRVASSTSTEPGSATDWIRAAVFTLSPATIPSPGADHEANLSRHDPRSCRQARQLPMSAVFGDAFDNIQSRAHRALRIIVMGDGRTPHRDHRVPE
jgi:hypothetical protein